MKKAINFRLEENIIIQLEQLSKKLDTTKTDVIEKAIELFSKQNKDKNNNDLIRFAGIINNKDADSMLSTIKNDKNIKDIDLGL